MLIDLQKTVLPINNHSLVSKMKMTIEIVLFNTTVIEHVFNLKTKDEFQEPIPCLVEEQ